MGDRGSKYSFNWAIIGPPTKRHWNGVSLADRWWPNIECWLFEGIRTSIAKKLYIFYFSGGSGPPVPPPPIWIRPCCAYFISVFLWIRPCCAYFISVFLWIRPCCAYFISVFLWIRPCCAYFISVLLFNDFWQNYCQILMCWIFFVFKFVKLDPVIPAIRNGSYATITNVFS